MDDSICHRLWICSYTDRVRKRKGTPGSWCPPEHAYAMTRIIDLMDQRLWLHAIDDLRATHGWDVERKGTFNKNRPFYTDGSCINPSHGVLARASFAIIQTDPTTGELTFSLVANVPATEPQTAAMAEQLAATWTLHLLYSPHRLPCEAQDHTGDTHHDTHDDTTGQGQNAPTRKH